MNILGINAVYHESSAALLVDGKIVAACEEERFNRIKHAKEARIDNPHEPPEQSIRFCLDAAGLQASQIDRVAYSFDPRIRRAEFHADWWPNPQMEPEFLRCLGAVDDATDAILGRKRGRAVKFVSHHLAHAASAYYPSGFDPAAILVIDGIGEAACSTLARGEGPRIEIIETFSYPHSLGFVWEQASAYLGFSTYDAAKVMGLAAYGDPEVYRQQLASVIRVSEDSYEVDLAALGFFPTFHSGFEALLGPSRKEDEEILPRHMDFAATLQMVTDAAVVALLRRLERSVKADRLCVAGGVALNCVTNELIRKASSYAEIFIPSAPHDAGTAVGAALAVYCAERRTKPAPSGATPYLGPQFDEGNVLAAVKQAGLTARRSKDAAREAADMIADGNIVGWFQGRMEFGPRALGNRSLLADPRHPDTRPSTGKTFGRSHPASLPNAPANGSTSGRIGQPRIHAVCLSDESRASRTHSGRASSRRNGTSTTRAARGQSALPRVDFTLLRSNRRAARSQHLAQRQRADRLHACPRDRHVLQGWHRRAVYGRHLPYVADLSQASTIPPAGGA